MSPRASPGPHGLDGDLLIFPAHLVTPGPRRLRRAFRDPPEAPSRLHGAGGGWSDDTLESLARSPAVDSDHPDGTGPRRVQADRSIPDHSNNTVIFISSLRR